VMNPIICVIWCSKAAANFLPLPFPVWATFFALLFTVLNLRGIKASARTNAAIAAGLVLVIVLFLVAAFRYLAGVTLDSDAFVVPDASGAGIFAAGCARSPVDVATATQEGTAAALLAIQTIRGAARR